MTAPASEPGRLHPAAEAWWQVLGGLSETDRRFVHLALVRRTRADGSWYADVMLSAILACHDDIGRYPSARAYQLWRDDQPYPDEWPSVWSIRSRFTSWSKALAELGTEPGPDILIHRLRGRSPAFTAEEILTGIDQAAKEWRAGHPGVPFRFIDYRTWLEIELARDQPRFERLCRARKTVIHYLGPWASVLTRLGHADLLSRVVVTTQQHRSNAELIGWIRQAASDTGLGNKLTPNAYDAWADATEQKLRTHDPTAHIARYRMIRRRFKTWANSLHQSGLLTDAEHQLRKQRPGVQMTDQQLQAALAEALDSLGDDASRNDYRHYRLDRLTGHNPPRNGIPSDGCLIERIGNGSWHEAKESARRRP